MPITIDVLIDTNILLRTQFDKPIQMTNASRALAKLRSNGNHLAVTIQNLAEFWNVSTRTEAANGHGLSREETLKRLEYFERTLTILSESKESYLYWKNLIVNHDVRGAKVHDTRLVSIMMVFGISRILTFNIADFARFDGIVALHPDQVLENS